MNNRSQDNPYIGNHAIRKPTHGRDPAHLYCTINQVAAMRGCSNCHVRQQIYMGRLPAWQIGGVYLIPRPDAEAWATRQPAIDLKGRGVQLTQKRLRKLEQAAARRAYEAGNITPRAKRSPQPAGG